MELTEQSKVVVVLPFLWDEHPAWYRNAVGSINWESSDNRHETLNKWFKTHYDTIFSYRDNRWRIEFPNQEKYLECVLTWS
jgi:hypothetical protein